MKHLLTLLLIMSLTTGLAAAGNNTQQSIDHPSADGLTIHSTSRGHGEPVLAFVHGWSCDSTYWRAQIADLADEYRVITIDLAGHGKSQAGRKAYTMEAFGQDVADALTEWDVDNVILVGHSMGGAVITEAALAVPDRILGLIGVDNFQHVTMKMGEQQIAGFVSTFDRDFANFTNQWVRSMFPAGADSALVADIAGDMASAPPEVAISAMEELLYWFGGLAPTRLQELNVPLMCINSDKQPTDEEAMRAIIPTFQARYLNGTGHFLFLEDPAGFNKLLRETMGELMPKK